MNLQSENLNTRINDTGELVIEPSYLTYVRHQGHTIESVDETHIVPSESEKGKSYLVVKVTTYAKPKNHPDLDYADDEIDLVACSCWSYQNNSVDVAAGEKRPDGSCKHCRSIWKTKRAQEDDSQETLV